MVVDLVVETFGPFAIPVVLFFIGVAFYVAVVALQVFRGEEDYWAEGGRGGNE